MSRFLRSLLPLLILPLAIVLVGASAVAPVISLATGDVESRDIEDGEEKETETRTEQKRDAVRRVETPPAAQQLLPSQARPPLQDRSARPAADTWSAPRRL